MSLCRHFVRELRRSVLLDTPENEKGQSKRSSQVLNQLSALDDGGPSNSEDQRMRDQQVSDILRQDSNSNGHNGHNGAAGARHRNGRHGADQHHSPQSSLGSNQKSSMQRSAPPSRGERPPRPSFMSSHLPTADSDSPAHTVARADLRASAEKILYTYLLAGSEREIILPQGILNDIISAIEDDHRDDPEVFDAAKDYVFQAMERDAFPGFLRSKALGNLVPPSMFARLALGLLGLFAGFWAAFVFIFLDLSRSTRCWVCVPTSFWTPDDFDPRLTVGR